MKCPCCKVINSLNEYLKHPSQTAGKVALRAWDTFVEMDKEKLILAIFPCPKHGTEDGYIAFIDEANAKKKEIVDRGKNERERLAAQALNRLFQDAVSRVLGIRI